MDRGRSIDDQENAVTHAPAPNPMEHTLDSRWLFTRVVYGAAD